MKKISILLLLFFAVIKTWGQEINFQIIFSEPLAVFDFVDNLSSNSPDNSFKKLFSSSKFNQEKYKTLIVEFDKLCIDYSYEYTEYPYAQKIGGSTKYLLKKSLINSQTINDFKIRSVGIIPNVYLFTLSSILTEFTPIYQELVYQPNKEKFEKQLSDIQNLVVSENIASYFNVGLKLYNSSWDNSIPFEIAFYPLPNSKGFTATAFYNNAVSAIPTSLKDYNILLGVMIHEIFHILYDEQSLLLKKDIEKWVNSNPSKNSSYAFLLLNESLATALGNGYVYGDLNGKEDTAAWYNRKYTNLMAKKIYPLVKEYILKQQSIDKTFVDNYIKIYDDNFSNWSLELDNLMTNRYILSDNSEDFNIVNQKFPYSSMSVYEDNVSQSSIEKMTKAPITKIIFISKDHKNKLQLVKQNFNELKNWEPNDQIDFTYSVLVEDKTYLLIINSVKNTTEEQIETLTIK